MRLDYLQVGIEEIDLSTALTSLGISEDRFGTCYSLYSPLRTPSEQ